MFEPIIFQNADGARLTFNDVSLLTLDTILMLKTQGYKLISGYL